MSLKSVLSSLGTGVRNLTGGTDLLSLEAMSNIINGIVKRSEADVAVSDMTVTIPAGYYDTEVSKTVISEGSFTYDVGSPSLHKTNVGDYELRFVRIPVTVTGNVTLHEGDAIDILVPATEFGTAASTQVAYGATFTSHYGVNISGTKIELGAPLEDVLYVTGGSVAFGSTALDVYEHPSRMTALAKNGVKPLADINNICSEDAYFISVPANATKITVSCPGFITGLRFIKYENDEYTTANNLSWLTLDGTEYSFEAGAYSHVAINYKYSDEAKIPTDVDTSNFSIVFD